MIYGATLQPAFQSLKRYHLLFIGGIIFLSIVLISLIGPYFVPSPFTINASNRLQPPFSSFIFGTDFLGRNLLSRVIYGGRISLAVGFGTAAFSLLGGLIIALIGSYSRITDIFVMRLMDALMSIPGILLAIALIVLTGATITTVILAITITDIPKVVRLLRSVILSAREEVYVKAAIALGTRIPKIFYRHILPNTVAPLIVQGTFIFGSAILTESLLGFLGAGIAPETPTWGNIMSEGRMYFQLTPWIIYIPGAFVIVTILAVNLIGDGLQKAFESHKT